MNSIPLRDGRTQSTKRAGDTEYAKWRRRKTVTSLAWTTVEGLAAGSEWRHHRHVRFITRRHPMSAPVHSVGIVLMLCGVAASAAAPSADSDKAGDRCEAAVAETVKRM